MYFYSLFYTTLKKVTNSYFIFTFTFELFLEKSHSRHVKLIFDVSIPKYSRYKRYELRFVCFLFDKSNFISDFFNEFVMKDLSYEDVHVFISFMISS